MWICRNDSFLSIVDKGTQPGKLCVRARVKGHIEAVFPVSTVLETPENDYAYRAFIDREEVAQAILDTVKEIRYDNFKNSVDDDDLHCAYGKVWSTMFSYGLNAERTEPNHHDYYNNRATAEPFSRFRRIVGKKRR